MLIKLLFVLYRFYSLWDTTYAKIHIPIIASVSEHQPTTWFSFFFDLHILVCIFPAGLWYCIQEYNDERLFGMNLYNNLPIVIIFINLFCLFSGFICLECCVFCRCYGPINVNFNTSCMYS